MAKARQSKQDLYKQDGVNISLGDMFSKYAGNLCRETYDNSPYVKVHDFSRGNFRGPRGWKMINLPRGCWETGVMDGIGTKVVLIDAAEIHSLGANDLIAMTAMDITRWGGMPLIFLNILDVSSLGKNMHSDAFQASKELIFGLSDVCHTHGYVMFTGELAELGLCVGSENPDASLKFNWGGCMIGVYHNRKMILGDTLKAGQAVMVLKDDLRGNGASLFRKALSNNYGKEWWDNPNAKRDIKMCAQPSVQYDRFFNYLHGWLDKSIKPRLKMHALIHLSGGAFESKLGGDILKPLGLSAILDNLFEPPSIMRKCAEWRGVSDEEFYRVLNGGQGAAVVIDKESIPDFLKLASKFKLDVQLAGKIVKSPKSFVRIHSKLNKGYVFEYNY